MVKGVCVFKPNDGLIEEGGSVGWATVVVRKPGTVLVMLPISLFILIHYVDMCCFHLDIHIDRTRVIRT